MDKLKLANINQEAKDMMKDGNMYDDYLLQTSSGSSMQSKFEKYIVDIQGPSDLDFLQWNQARNLVPADVEVLDDDDKPAA